MATTDGAGSPPTDAAGGVKSQLLVLGVTVRAPSGPESDAAEGALGTSTQVAPSQCMRAVHDWPSQ